MISINRYQLEADAAGNFMYTAMKYTYALYAEMYCWSSAAGNAR